MNCSGTCGYNRIKKRSVIPQKELKLISKRAICFTKYSKSWDRVDKTTPPILLKTLPADKKCVKIKLKF